GGLFALGCVLGLLFRGRRVGRLGNRRRRRLDLRLDRRLLAPLGGGRRLVGARTLDIVLATGAVARSRLAPTAAGAAAALAAAPALRANRAQVGAVALAV